MALLRSPALRSSLILTVLAILAYIHKRHAEPLLHAASSGTGAGLALREYRSPSLHDTLAFAPAPGFEAASANGVLGNPAAARRTR